MHFTLDSLKISQNIGDCLAAFSAQRPQVTFVGPSQMAGLCSESCLSPHQCRCQGAPFDETALLHPHVPERGTQDRDSGGHTGHGPPRRPLAPSSQPAWSRQAGHRRPACLESSKPHHESATTPQKHASSPQCFDCNVTVLSRGFVRHPLLNVPSCQ